jgi:dinuclear metal center YbgI/SA1388 family protein
MTGNVAKFSDVLDRIAPVQLAEAWDNVGLQIGSRHWPVKKIWTALDPLPEVVAKACENNVDLLVTHHPLFFKPIKRIDCDTPLGRIAQMALSCQLAIYSTHTNLDSAVGGVNDVLAERIGLHQLRVLAESGEVKRCNDESMADDVYPLAGVDQHTGLGRVGELSSSISLGDFAEKIKTALNIGTVKVVGNLDKRVHKVAVCSGSGSSLLSAALGSGAQVYVSGDLGYHTARDAQQNGIGLVDISHFGSERLIVDVLATSIQNASKALGLDVTVEATSIETDPFHHL